MITIFCIFGVGEVYGPFECNFCQCAYFQMLVLKAEVGTGPQMQIVPLRNAGNIPLDVSLEMAHWTDLFTVTPMQVMIEPGGQSEVCVRFEPTSTAVKGVRFDR